MNRIYQNQILKIGYEIQLDPSASQHVLNVLRLRIDEKLIVFNGTGGEYHATLVGIVKNLARICIDKFDAVDREPTLAIHLGQCLSRGERMDYAIQKSVEVGVTEITPLLATRCNVKIQEERLDKRLTHWRHIVISACEQSGRTCIPTLNPPMALRDWVMQCQGVNVVADFNHEEITLDALTKHINLLIGPEGGLTTDEIEFAKAHHFKSLCLGPLTLRTETAPIVAITQLQIRALR